MSRTPPDRHQQTIRELVEALEAAKETIRIWHGMGFDRHHEEPVMWDLYQRSPEMERLNAALARARGES